MCCDNIVIRKFTVIVLWKVVAIEDKMRVLEYLRHFSIAMKSKEKLTYGTASNETSGYTEGWIK